MLLLFTAGGCAQSTRRAEIYRAFFSGDMSRWHDVMTDFAATHPTEPSQQLELLDYYYGYTAWLIGNDKNAEAKAFVEKAEHLIDELSTQHAHAATVKAYKGAFIGFRIGLNPLKAPFLGPKSIREINDTLKIDPHNIQANIEQANALYYRPAFFGGDKKLAIEHYVKALQLMEKKGAVQQNWNYLNLLTVLAQAYEETGELQAAKHTLEKALKIEPNFLWVRNELYPALLSKTE